MRRVEALRLERDWSKRFLGRVAFVDVSRISLITTGRTTPPREGVELQRLARALAWPVDRAGELLDEVDGPREDPEPAASASPASLTVPMRVSEPSVWPGGATPTAVAGVLVRLRERDRLAV